MTVIAWDGMCLAADKQMTLNGMKVRVTKIHLAADGAAIGACGDSDSCAALIDWYHQGKDPVKWPACQSNKNTWATLIVKKLGSQLHCYFQTPVPINIDEPFMAWGEDAPYAMAAMDCGGTAEEAVKIASIYSTSCGCGVDVVRPR
jgi:hypothetical protein